MPLFHVDENQMSFLETIIVHLDAKAEDLRLKGLFVEENGRTIIEIQTEDIIRDLEQEEGITINYSKDELETIANRMRHFDNSDRYDSIEEGILDTLL